MDNQETRITLSTQDTGRRQTNQKPQHDEKHEPHQNKPGVDQGVILYTNPTKINQGWTKVSSYIRTPPK